MVYFLIGKLNLMSFIGNNSFLKMREVVRLGNSNLKENI